MSRYIYKDVTEDPIDTDILSVWINIHMRDQLENANISFSDLGPMPRPPNYLRNVCVSIRDHRVVKIWMDSGYCDQMDLREFICKLYT